MAEHAASATYGWENKYHWVRRLPREWSLRPGACCVPGHQCRGGRPASPLSPTLPRIHCLAPDPAIVKLAHSQLVSHARSILH